jgi:hypothetical protein
VVNIQRFDINPQNVTFGRWVHITSFPTRAAAESYIKRAQSRHQHLRIEE